MSAGTIFETAIHLATQAVAQDKAKNYPEAARCYREAVATFASVRGKCATPQVSAAVDAKIAEYRDRLRKLDHYLLSKADLSKIFKSAVEYHVENQSYHTSQCTDVQKGIQLIEKAKKRDQDRQFEEAISLYEQGSAELLKVAITAQKENRQEQSDKIRFKCLLIHERIDEIRNALENGRDVKDRREGTAAGDSSLQTSNRRGFDSCSASPEPPCMPMPLMTLMSMGSVATSLDMDNDTESRVFLMDEVRSSMQSLAMMTRSCTQIPVAAAAADANKPGLKRSPSLNSDFGGSNTSSGASCDMVPLANIDQDMTLSDDSVAEDDDDVDSVYSYSETVRRMVGIKTADPSMVSSRCSLSFKQKCRSFHFSAENVLSATAHLQSSPAVEQDRNVSEVIVPTTTVDLDTSCSSSSLPLLLNTSCESDRDSGSDSGISNPCSTWKRASPPCPPVAESPTLVIDVVTLDKTDDVTSTVSTDEGTDLVQAFPEEETVVIHPSPPPECLEVVHVEVEGAPSSSSQQSSTPSPTLSRTSMGSSEQKHQKGASPLTRKSSTLKKSYQSASIDELRVLSSEDVVDCRPLLTAAAAAATTSSATPKHITKKSVKLNPSPKVESDYYYGQTDTMRRREYVPPRAFASHPDFEDETAVNKGCYYFFSCLDAFWIL